MRRHILLATALALLAPVAISAPLTAATEPAVSISMPSTAVRGRMTAATITMPSNVAAVDGRVLFARRAVEVIGVATIGGGTGLKPVEMRGGASFGAYDLRATAGHVRLQVVLLPRRTGRLSVRLVVDSMASRAGRRLGSGGVEAVRTLSVPGGRQRSFSAPSAAGPRPGTALAVPRELVPDGRFTRRDLDTARLEWYSARERDAVCSSGRSDANGDGCTDIVDVQASLALQGRRTSVLRPAIIGRRAIAGVGVTFVVRSTADTPDVTPGDGVCADDQGRCTLRAAMMEADWLAGDDRVEFDLATSAPVVIQLASRLPAITSRGGTVTIDAYTQPGSQANTAEFGSNAIPGIELRGNGASAREVGFRITSAGNTVRGFAIREIWRGFVLDGTGAADNRIIGNWVGFTGAGGAQTSNGQYGVLINTGAHDNLVGTAARADRNVMGNVTIGVDMYGPGTDRNIIRGNLFCIRPGGATATCSNGIDHNHGPKANVIGGDDPGELNVIGPTRLQGIELSHGWNPDLPYGTDTATTYQVNDNRVIGNWVGFRANGTYDAEYRSGLVASTADNAQGINVYDGTNDNLIARNYIGSRFDGIQLMSSNSRRNTVRGNRIGVSPQGEAAPLTGWGIVVRWGTRFDVIASNVIRNAARGGIGLLDRNAAGGLIAVANNIRISRNVVSDTTGPAIDLFGVAGPDPNDAGDGDTGANTLLNTPVITYADTGIVRGTGVNGALVEVFRAGRAVGAYGLPGEFLGDATVGTDGTWAVAVTGLVAGDRVTSLQIRADDNTSELSRNVAVVDVPAVGAVVGSDDFGRTVTNGWGTADTGGNWAVNGTGLSVAGGEGRAATAAGTGREARLPVATADVLVTGRLTIDRVPVGGQAYAYVLARASAGNGYRGMVRVAPSGIVYVQLKALVAGAESNLSSLVDTGIVATAAMNLRFRLEVVGNQLRFRVWPAGAGEPGTWLVTATDSTHAGQGATGLAVFTGANTSNGPITWALDEFVTRQGS